MTSPIDLDTFNFQVIEPTQNQIDITDGKIAKAIYYIFSALSSIAALGVAAGAFVGVFSFSAIAAIVPLAFIAIRFMQKASKIPDFSNPKEIATIRQSAADKSFVQLYREYGMNALFNLFTLEELKAKFNQEVKDPKTTFWNILRRYNKEELFARGLITKPHLDLLNELNTEAYVFNNIVFMGKEHHVLTLYANQPEAVRAVIELDNRYTAFKAGL